MTERGERHSVDVSNATGSANFESGGDADLATELFRDSDEWSLALDVTVGPISTCAVLDEPAARQLHSQLGNYLTRMDSEEPGIGTTNPGP